MTEGRIFITGGASGLGRALAERYAKHGWSVCIGDIHQERLGQTVEALRFLGAPCHGLEVDVTREEDLRKAARWLGDNWRGVDVVVNNAGVAVAGGITEVSLDDWQWIVDINLLGVVRGCKVFTPMMRAAGGGQLVNVASMAGLVHPPMMAAYNATKAAVVAVSESLRLELADDGISVSVVCPGFFRTNLSESMRAATRDLEGITQRLVNGAARGAEEIAELVARGIERRDFHILTHGDGRIAWMMKRLMPASLYFAAMARQTKRLMGRPEPVVRPEKIRG